MHRYCHTCTIVVIALAIYVHAVWTLGPGSEFLCRCNMPGQKHVTIVQQRGVTIGCASSTQHLGELLLGMKRGFENLDRGEVKPIARASGYT